MLALNPLKSHRYRDRAAGLISQSPCSASGGAIGSAREGLGPSPPPPPPHRELYRMPLGLLASWALGNIATRWLPIMPARGSLEAWLCGVFGVYWLGIGFGFDRRALPLGLNMVQVMRREWVGRGCNLTVACPTQRILGQLQIATAAHIDVTPHCSVNRGSPGEGRCWFDLGVDGRRVASVRSSDLEVCVGPWRSSS